MVQTVNPQIVGYDQYTNAICTRYSYNHVLLDTVLHMENMGVNLNALVGVEKIYKNNSLHTHLPWHQMHQQHKLRL